MQRPTLLIACLLRKMLVALQSYYRAMMFGILLLSGMAALSSCESFTGDKTSTDFLDTPTAQRENVAYVPLQPPFEGLQYPTDVIAGFDELIYVADSAAEKIKSYDVAGTQLGSIEVPGLTAIAQNRSLELLAVGTFDTTINETSYTLSTIYRIDMIDGRSLSLDNAEIVDKIVHPFYSGARSFTSADTLISFQDVGVLADNKFYATRTGPGISAISQDNTVLLFNEDGSLQTPICISTSTGRFCDYFEQPVAITTRVKPPQRATPNTDGDFIFTSMAPGRAIKTQYINRNASPNGVSYELRQLTRDTSQADGYLYKPNRFRKPSDVTIAGDATNYIFVADRAKDSVYQFTANGLEGVNAPPGANTNRNIKVSFGGTGSGPRQFRKPTGVAYFQKRLYVADGANGVIKRFRLTTDFD